jgi:two-component system, NtrC family, response regulator
MQSQAEWATGFLTQLLLQHLKNHYPAQMKKIDPRSFFTGIEGYESIKDPQTILMDRHAWIPEEVLRELLRTAERVTGRKDIAYHAAIDYFTRSASGSDDRAPSIFEIMARVFDDARTMALFSSLWANAYTTFMQLQAIMKEPEATELILLSQCLDGFRPLVSTHYMLKGNYEGFVRLYDFVEEAHLEEEFFQYRVRDVVSEFEDYSVDESRGVRIMDRRTRKPAVVLEPVQLELEEFQFIQQPMETLGGFRQAASESQNHWIVKPEDGRIRVHVPHRTTSRSRAMKSSGALQVVKGGTLRSGPLEYHFREGLLYDAPYSRYRFRWKQRSRQVLQGAELEKRIQKMTYLLFDYLRELKATQQRLLAYAVENKALTTENIYLRQSVDEQWASKTMLGESPGLKDILRLVHQVAPTDSAILITGETGTGKELVARLIHEKSSRRNGRFVAVNCGAIPEGLLESELFGHEKGAFTGAVGRRLGRFELAHEGTLFLDEIGDISPAMQVKLLRVLQERAFERVGGDRIIQVDVRIVAATHQNLQDLISTGQFRKDLFYRLNVIPFQLPPLRNRLEDISILAEHFLKKYATKLRKQLRHLSADTISTLKGYSWPGNVRELENIMERVVTLALPEQSLLAVEMLPGELRTGPSALPQTPVMDELIDQMDWNRIMDLLSSEGSMDSVLKKIEWGLARRAIRVYGNKSQAARALKRTYRWIRKLEKQMETRLPT